MKHGTSDEQCGTLSGVRDQNRGGGGGGGCRWAPELAGPLEEAGGRASVTRVR